MFDQLLTWFGRKPEIQAASQLPEVPAPKVKPGGRAYAPFMTSTKPADTKLPQKDRRLSTTDVTAYRSGTTTPDIIRDFIAASPDLSAAAFAYLRVGITNGHTAVAVNPDGSFHPEATSLTQQIIQRMDMLPDYSVGFSGTWSLRSLAESLGKEILTYGAMSSELVLDKARLPSRIQPVSTKNVKFYPDKNGILKPVQMVGSEEIDLDYPTFFYTALDQDLLEPYPSSMMEPAIKAVIFAEDFIADLQRVAKRAVHPRLYVKLVEDSIRKYMPAEAHHDPKKLQEYLATVMQQVQDTVNGLEPEDALVLFDSIEADYMNNGNVSIGDEWTTLQNLINAKLSTGAKTMPAILGHGVGSQNVASAEALLFVKAASGAIQQKLNEHFSRIFTLAVRLFGHDVVVRFNYNEIDLRPDSELEAFKSQKQSRVLEQLSLGMISDEEAALQITGKLPPKGYKPLSGTMFKSAKSDGNANPNGETNGGSTTNQNLNKDKTTGVRGGNTKADPQKADSEAPEVVAQVPSMTFNFDNTRPAEGVTTMRMRRDEAGDLIVERIASTPDNVVPLRSASNG